jgi:FKBP-type peptidyl-prolyl cis-trans isomerase
VVCHAAAPAATEDAASRRQLLLSMVTAAPVLTAVSATPAAQAAAAGTCEFVTAANGIQYCDTKEGEGPSPVKGALIRCAT